MAKVSLRCHLHFLKSALVWLYKPCVFSFVKLDLPPLQLVVKVLSLLKLHFIARRGIRTAAIEQHWLMLFKVVASG